VGKRAAPALGAPPRHQLLALYALQLNLYQYLLESKYGLKVSGRYLVCMHPERAFYELVPIVELQTEVREILT
jgi:hypothetical protein